MDREGFTLRSEDTKRDSWEGSASQLSSDLSTQMSESGPIFQLHLISKKEPKSKRPLIQSTKFERLSFYNTYTIPAWKTEPIFKEIANHNRHIFELNYESRNNSYLYYALLWAMAAFLTIYVSRKFFWKVLHCAHWSIILISICTVLYILLEQSGLKDKREFMASTVTNYKYLLTDLNIIEGITTAPALAHVLSSRSAQPLQIHPSGDSTAIIISTATYYMFRIYLSNKMSTYCKNVIGIPLDDFPNRYMFFLAWPIFFSNFYLGDLFSLFFLGLNSVAAIFSSSVTFRCLIEMVIYEWRKKIKIKPWMVIMAVFLSVVLLVIFFSEQVLGLLCLYAIGFATLSEIIILNIFYPLGRLIDDYTFHYGEPPTRLRKLSLQFAPFYYMLKFFALMYSLYSMRNSTDFKVAQYVWCWYLMLVPLILGMIFTIYKQHIIRKASILQLFSPDPKWGPKNFAVRQLRKQYDSRVYVKSDVPRSLSRYLLSQAEPKVYKLNVLYDSYKKHHVEPLEVRFRVEKEKKN